MKNSRPMMAIEPVLPAGFDAEAATAMDNVSCAQRMRSRRPVRMTRRTGPGITLSYFFGAGHVFCMAGALDCAFVACAAQQRLSIAALHDSRRPLDSLRVCIQRKQSNAINVVFVTATAGR